MIRRTGAIVVAVLLILAGANQAEDRPHYRMHLFDGDPLDQNEQLVVMGCEAETKNGVLLAKAGNGFIRSTSRYRDFVLEVEYRTLKKEMYDAGIYFRAELPPEGRPFPTQYQVNLKQGDELNLIRFPKAKSTG